MDLSAPPDGALTTPRFRQSMIPRPASGKKEDADSSPKSVIADVRFVSPGSSSSSSIDRRTILEANTLKLCQLRHDRGYSTSDGELSDPDSILDSTGTSRELGKVGNSGPLESLPETHSLALEATNSSSVPAAVETPQTLTASKRGEGEPVCRIPVFPSAKGLEASESTAIFVLADRSSDAGRGQHGSALHSSAALRGNKNYQDRAIAVPITRANAQTGSNAHQTRASEPAVSVEDQVERSEWSSQSATSSESASEQDGKEPPRLSTRRYVASESGSRRRDQSSRATYSAELSSSGAPLERGDDTKRRPLAPGAAANFGYPGTPLRFFPGWQGHLRSSPMNAPHGYSASPRVEKGAGSYSLTNSSDAPVGLRHQHRFLSGPIMGSMIPKPPPSKWDDAEKWIVSPGRKDSPAQPQHRSLQALLTGRRHSITGAQNFRAHHGMGSPDYATPPGEKPMSPHFENAFINAGKIDAPKYTSSEKKRSKALSFSDLSKKLDPSRGAAKAPAAQPQERGVREAKKQRAKALVASSTDTETKFAVNANSSELNERPLLAPYEETQEAQHQVDRAETAESIMNTSSSGDIKGSQIVKQPRSVSMKEMKELASIQEATSRRDMGTQMTPAESLKNSTCTTPGLTNSPSRHNTPAGRRASSLGAIPMAVDLLELQSCHLEKLEVRKLVGDDKPSVDRNVVWTTREEEEMESAASLREVPGEVEKCQFAAQATAWEEAKQTKSIVRFRKKEAKIKVWEEHKKSQAEAEMKKIEAKVEKILAAAKEKKKGRMAMATKKAAEMRAAAEVIRNQRAAKTAERAELMRKDGLLSPPSRSSFRCCFRG